MLGFLLRRFANYLVLILIATSVGYVLATLTLNPRAKYDALQPRPPEASIVKSLSDLNMNPADPPLDRLGRWAKGIVTKETRPAVISDWSRKSRETCRTCVP